MSQYQIVVSRNCPGWAGVDVYGVLDTENNAIAPVLTLHNAEHAIEKLMTDPFYALQWMTEEESKSLNEALPPGEKIIHTTWELVEKTF